MNLNASASREMPLLVKLALLGVVGLFVVIGLLGLILPIIPGVLFLALAALLMARLSSRFAFHLENHDAWQKLRRWWRSASYLSLGQRLKLGCWLSARAMVKLLQDGVDFISRRQAS